MDELLLALRAAAEPTRLRLLALAARGAFCVVEFTEILGQSQPRLSRHLKLLCEAGLLERVREGANVWFALPAADPAAPSAQALLARDLIARLPGDDPVLEADRRQAARVLAERARVASESFRRQGADWDEMRALDLPAGAVEEALLAMLPLPASGADGRLPRLIDIGTGTGRLLELLGPRVGVALGIDASKSMLALARARLARAEFAHCSVRLADMYRLPLADGATGAGFDIALMQMVLHYAEDPAGAIAEAARVLRPGGTLLAIDLAAHDDAAQTARLAHRWPGFTDAALHGWMEAAGLAPGAVRRIAGPLTMCLWSATRAASVTRPDPAAAFAV